MKEIIGKSKIISSSLPKRITVDSIAKETPVDIAEAFNNFFINIGPELSAKIPDVQRHFESYLDKTNASLDMTEITHEEFKNAFFSLKINKSTGYDEVSANVVKNIYDELKTPLMHIFNLSISKGIFPVS